MAMPFVLCTIEGRLYRLLTTPIASICACHTRSMGWARYTNSIALNRYHRTLAEFAFEPFKDLPHESDACVCRNIGKSHDSIMLHLVQENEFAKVGVDRHEDTILTRRPFQQCPVAWVGAKIARLQDVVPFQPEPFGQLRSSTSVDQEPQRPTTSTASSESLATIVRAYSKHAWMSAASRSG